MGILGLETDGLYISCILKEFPPFPLLCSSCQRFASGRLLKNEYSTCSSYFSFLMVRYLLLLSLSWTITPSLFTYKSYFYRKHQIHILWSYLNDSYNSWSQIQSLSFMECILILWHWKLLEYQLGSLHGINLCPLHICDSNIAWSSCRTPNSGIRVCFQLFY